MSLAEIRRRVRRIEHLTARWSYQCKYHGWGQFDLVHKACAEVGITDAQYWTYRRPYCCTANGATNPKLPRSKLTIGPPI